MSVTKAVDERKVRDGVRVGGADAQGAEVAEVAAQHLRAGIQRGLNSGRPMWRAAQE
jgi:hypothetical protein